MNYMEPSQFRTVVDNDGIYLVCTICQASTGDIRDLQDALEEARRHTQDAHECSLQTGAVNQ